MPKNPHADFTPTLAGYSGITPFRFWCQTALPLTYDDSLSYYELLNKVVNYLNHTIEDLTNVENNTSELAEAYGKLQKYVNDYFDDIDIEAELRNVLDGMAEDGTLDALLDPLVENQLPGVVDEKIDEVVASQIDEAVAGQIDESVADQLPAIAEENVPGAVSEWLTENVNPVGSAVVVDSSLTISGAAADAKVTGDVKNTLAITDSLVIDNVSIDIPTTTRGSWDITNETAVLTPASSGSYYAFQAIEVTPLGVYIISIGANTAHPPIIVANYENNIYNVLSFIEVASVGRIEETIIMPQNATHILLTKYGGQGVTISQKEAKTDKTLAEENVPADAKETGEKIAEILAMLKN